MSSEALNSLRETLRLLMSRHAGGEKRENTYKDGFQQGLAAAIDEIDKIPATQFVALATIPPDCAIGEFYGFTETTTLYHLVTVEPALKPEVKRGRPSTGFDKSAYMKEYMRKKRRRSET